MAAQLIAGVCFLKVDGVQYSLRGNFSVQPLSFQNEGIAGQDGVHGFKQTVLVPSIEGDLSDLGSFSVAGLQNVTNSTVTAELANGKVYILRNAWFAGPAKIDAAEGKIAVKFEGLSCEEDLAA